jgi:uncharacterized membrane protein
MNDFATTFAFALELARPAWLFGLLLIPVLIYYFIKSLCDLPRRQRVVSLIGRSLILTLLVLCLAGLTLLKPTAERYVVFAVDRSVSVGDDSRKAEDAFIESAKRSAGRNRYAVLPFAARPGALVPDRPRGGRDDSKPAEPLDEKGTDIAAAIEVAKASCPPFFVPKIVVLSDGNATSGDAIKASLRAGAPISTVAVEPRKDPEAQVSAVEVPAQVRQGEPFRVEVVVDSNHDDEGEIEVYRGPIKVVSERKKIKKGENRFRFDQRVDDERLATYTARIKGFKDTLLDNNSDSGLVFTDGKPRVLVIESDPKSAERLAWALEEQDVKVDVRPPQGAPDDLSDLQNYELLVLSNVPATSLTSRQMEIARTYVQDLGGGLMMLGGDQSFGLGGYYKTVVEEILPVRSDFEKEKEKPSLAMVLIIDKSGSMGGEKIEMAKEAARAAVELLGPNDKIGVIAFEGESYWVSEIHPCSDKGFVLDRVATIDAGGGTVMYPAMDEAYQALRGTVAKLKHVIILTDGISAPGDFEGITQSMAQDRITVTTVGVGDDADRNLLEEIARIGSGRFYEATDPGSVPQIFAKETVTASKSAINEQPFTPQVIRPSQALSGVDLESAPFLLGYVITRPKSTAEVILATESGDPLLAWWRYGLGFSVAFTSDAKNRWAAEWVNWPEFGKFWAQIARHSMRKGDAKGTVVQLNRRDRKATIALDAIEPSGRFLNDAQTELTVIDPQLGETKIEPVQTAPGRYQAEFDTTRAGSYHLELTVKRGGAVVARQSRGIAVGYPDELRIRATNEASLKSIARLSGGVYNPKPETVFDPTETRVSRAIPLWPYLAAFAAVLFTLDVALRRIDFSLVFGGFERFSKNSLPLTRS